MGLTLEAGSLQTLLALVSALLWCATGLASPSYFASAEGCSRYYFFWLLTEGALMGVFLAGDLFTLFVFFEMMSMASYVWVAQNETGEALRAAETYLAVAVIGGMVLLAGILLLQHLLGTLALDQLAGADGIQARVTGQDLLCHCHSHVLLAPLFTRWLPSSC